MRARRVGFAIAVLSLVAAGAWWLWPSPEEEAMRPGEDAPSAAPVTHHHDPTPQVLENSDGGAWSLRGRVVNAEGQAVAGATVDVFVTASLRLGGQLCDACGNELLWCTDPSTVLQVLDLAQVKDRASPATASVTADVEGRFLLDGLEPRPLRLLARGGGHTGYLDVDEVPADDEELLVTIGSATGRQLRVLAEDGSPVGPVTITLITLGTDEVRQVQTDRDGRVQVNDVSTDVWAGLNVPGWLPVGEVLNEHTELVLQRPRTLVIRTRMGGKPVDADVELNMHADVVRRTQGGEVRFTGLSANQGGLVRASAGDLSSDRVGFVPQAPETVLTLELRRAASLEVHVVDAEGRPLEAAWIELVGPGGQRASPVDDEEGALVRFVDIPEGEYRLDVGALGFVQDTRSLDLAPGLAAVQVVLQRGAVLEGVVVDPQGKPVPRAEISLSAGLAAPEDVTETDDDGRFEFQLVPPGPITLSAWSPTGGHGSLVTRAGEVVTVALRAGATLEVEVLDVDGSRIVDTLEVSNAEARLHYFAESGDPFGRIAGLAPGTWLISLSRQDRAPLTHTVELGPDQVQRVSLRLTEGEVIEGRVLEADGKPVPEAQVVAGSVSSATTDAQGRFRVQGVQRGEVHLFAISPEGERSTSIEVQSPARDIELHLEALYEVSGRVVGPGGRPVTHFRIDRAEVSDPAGKFSLRLPHGHAGVFAEGYRVGSFEVERAGDQGTVRLEEVPMLRGLVLADGKPVPGAKVTHAETLMETVSDMEGRFELPVEHEDAAEQHVLALRGALSGKGAGRVGGAPLRIALTKGTHVTGRVVDAAGAGFVTQVQLSLGTEQVCEHLVTTDGQGRFEIDLPAGTWLMTPRNGSAQSFTISGARQDVTLVDARTCVLSLEAPEVELAWLLPPGGAGAVNWVTGEGLPPGSISVLVGDPTFVTAAPCGRYELVAVAGTTVRRHGVSLEPGKTPVRLEPPAPPAQSE